MKGLGVCVDYDDTFSTNPELWTKIIEMMREAGAHVFCISLRFPNFPIGNFPGEVYYASGQLKWEFAESLGLKVDIWIDDWPAVIGDRGDRRGDLPVQFYMRKLVDKGVLTLS
jgi:hypothetical protein